MRFLSAVLTALLCICTCNVALAQKPPAFTDAAAAGPDFEYQGEFSGIVTGGFRQQRLGVQIIALGDDKFRAVEFLGGLPGNGWNGVDKAEFETRRENGLLVIPGVARTTLVMGSSLWVHRKSDGRLLGILRRARRRSPTLGAEPPLGATVLFDGTSTDAFSGAKITADGLLEVGPITRRTVRDFLLHLEFRTPFMPAARGQARGNSGVYIQRRYEVQILDSFGLAGHSNECGGLYQRRPPDVNMCLPPLSWQTYDIRFRAARWDAQGNKSEPARITVLHNGVPIHEDVELAGKTGAGRRESPEPGPILLQDHGNPVNFRNIWILEPPQLLPLTASAAR